ncbi:MAG: site-specific DNA-methyltransferase [Planctomycetes bacterium]|nr:site-specific DNA-methyltransferase [Planctomycetota bacterium]
MEKTQVKPYYNESGVTIYLGDALDTLRQMEAESVQCCVTSPPYYGLRDYGTATWEGGDVDCDHIESMARNDGERVNTQGFGGNSSQNSHMGPMGYRRICKKCGATRIDKQIGLEETPEDYVAKMVEVFAEVKRVLKNDGVLWLNMGDSYGQQQGKGFPGTGQVHIGENNRNVKWNTGLPPKNLLGMPWRVALALQEPTMRCQRCNYKSRESVFGKFLNGAYSICPKCAKRHGNKQPVKVADGWWLRQGIIWHKPNPMPESVTDRCTKAHEDIFLMSKSARYFWAADAIAEDSVWPEGSSIDRPRGSFGGKHGPMAFRSIHNTRNKRSVWTMNTQSFPGAHFATFPMELPTTCIKAGSKTGDTILDPFAGAGTTLLAAKNLHCKAVGIELNPDYIEIIKRRLTQDVFAFNP